jgi:hypothetical protein
MPKPAAAADSYTGRLLEAKRRALKRPGEQPSEGKK